MSRVGALITVVIVLGGTLRSQPPSPTPVRPTEAEQNQAPPKKQIIGPYNQPSKQTSSTSNQGDSKKAEREKSEASQGDYAPPEKYMIFGVRINDWLIVIFTGALVILAGLQFWAMHRQAGYMRKGVRISIRQSRIAFITAVAAKKSADIAEAELKLAHRADILISAASILDIHGINNLPIRTDSFVSLEFKNFGSTRAESVVFDIQIHIPSVPDWNRRIGPIVLGAGDTQEIRFSYFGEFLTAELAEGIGRGTVPLTFDGVIIYKDVFGEQHTIHPRGSFSARFRSFIIDTKDHQQQVEN